MNSRPLILVSNDDGIRGEGLRILVRELRRVARVVVVAPEGQQSASSHSLTLHRPLRVIRYSSDEFSVDGTPTDCITLALNKIMKKRPNLIVSGINHGANLGDDVHYSGTVSAAVEGALMGIRSLAVSLVIWGDQMGHFRTAARFVSRFSLKVLSAGLPAGFVMNINVPNLPINQVRDARMTKLGKRNYGEVIFEKIDPRGKKYYWVGGDERTFRHIPGSDAEAILAKEISVTPLQVDLTHYPLLDQLADWKF